MRVLIYVQHLMGVGHLKRASRLASSLEAKGVDVLVASGGAPDQSLAAVRYQTIQLPPVKAGTKGGIVDLDGKDLPKSWYNNRRDLLLKNARAFEPDIVITEHFPFGRRAFRFELIPLLDWAKSNGTKIVSSVRDILIEKKRSERNVEMRDLALQYFDAILVHSDPDIVPFGATFPYADDIHHLLHYTGFMRTSISNESEVGAGEVVISGGHGVYSESLFRTAIAAKDGSSLSDSCWRILVGYGLSQTVFDDLRGFARDDLVIERVRPDFLGVLKNARLSISHAGYNTILDVLAARVPAVLVPYIAFDDNEQFVRASLIAEREVVAFVDPHSLNQQTLRDGIDRALSLSAVSEQIGDTNGAERSAEIITHFV